MVNELIAWEPYCWIVGRFCIPTFTIKDQRAIKAAEETTQIIYSMMEVKW